MIAPHRSPSLAAALAGAVAALGHAPFDFWMLTPLALAAVFVIVAQARDARGAAIRVWFAGIGYFGLSLSWIVEPFLVTPERDGWMAPFALVLMAGGMALFWAGAVWAICAIGRRFPRILRLFPDKDAEFAQDNLPPRVFFALALAVMLAEIARATVLTGFPWAHPGQVLVSSDYLALAPILGGRGLSLLILLWAAALAAFWRVHPRRVAALAILPVGLALILPAPKGPVAPEGAPLIRIVQPNAPQDQKWRPEMRALFFDRMRDLMGAVVMSEGIARPDLSPDLILTPETALTALLDEAGPALADLAQAAQAPVLLGAQRLEGWRAYNSLALISPQGAVLDIYDKHRLVPFGEYMPLQEWAESMGLFGLANAMGIGFSRGQVGPDLFDLGALGRALPLICYEAIFAADLRAVARPDWIFHATNDGWFGEFSGPYQHLALMRLRAAEMGLPAMRAANTGVSAVIDARGQVVAQLGLGEAGRLDARLPAALPATLYARHGDLVFWLLFLATATALVLQARARRD